MASIVNNNAFFSSSRDRFSLGAAQRGFPSFGRGVDGDVSLSSATNNINTTRIGSNTYATRTVDAPVASVTAISMDTKTLTVTARAGVITDFKATDLCIIINQQGDGTHSENVGAWEFVSLMTDGSGSTITLFSALTNFYGQASSNTLTGQVVSIIRLPEYGALTLSSTAILSGSAWNGTWGGIIPIMAQSITCTGSGTISADALGYRGGSVAGGTGGGEKGGRNTVQITAMGCGGGGGGTGSVPSAGAIGGTNLAGNASGGGGGAGGSGGGAGGGGGYAATGGAGASGSGGGGGGGGESSGAVRATVGSDASGSSGGAGGIGSSGSTAVGGNGATGATGASVGAAGNALGISSLYPKMFMGGGGGASGAGTNGGNGGDGGAGLSGGGGAGGIAGAGGGGFSHGNPGSNGNPGGTTNEVIAGSAAGSSDGGNGGNGGGIVLIFGKTITGLNTSSSPVSGGLGGIGGAAGTYASYTGGYGGGIGGGGGGGGGAGAGAGGSVLVQAQSITVGSITAAGGTGGLGGSGGSKGSWRGSPDGGLGGNGAAGGTGGAGSLGRVQINYQLTGTTFASATTDGTGLFSSSTPPGYKQSL